MGSLGRLLRSNAPWLALIAVSVTAVYLWFAPAQTSPEERTLQAGALFATGLLGLLVAEIAQRFSERLRLRWQLTVAGLTGITVLVANIAVSVALMFLSAHDLSHLLILSAYALPTTVGPAIILSRGLARRIEAIEAAAGAIARGELTVRVPTGGRDEIAALAQQFNRMAAALEDANERRDRLERSRRDLFAAISHDLRTPLASIRVMVEAMSDGVVSDDATRERYYVAVSAEIQRLSLLIDDLFELTTIDSGELRLRLESLHIEEVVAEALDVFRPQVERAGIRLAYEAAAATQPVLADPHRLSRVLFNLLQNAVRHTPHDGTIAVRTEPTGDGVRVVVSDTGDGIAPDDVPYVFDRFFRGDKARGREAAGAGLGLSIARGIVEAHGGTISVESTPRKGTRFTVTLPARASS
ncbi:MAG: sensor histidine kinase [Dehalococcoidia bacterium]